MLSKPICNIELKVQVTLTEQEVGAIACLSSYSIDTFIKHFYEYLGKSYMQEYEQGLRSFLESTKGLHQHINRANAARKAFNDQ